MDKEESTVSDITRIHYCKKCGCELMSTNKKKLCANCKDTRNNTIKKILSVPLVAAISVATYKFKGTKK